MTGREPKDERWPRWLWLVGLVTVLLGAYAALTALLGPSDDTIGPIRGLRLGYATSMARERFTPGGEGSYRSEAQGEDLALVWTPASDDGPVKAARLEFHLGLLVAVRLTLRPDQPEASGPPLSVSEASVLTREPGDDGVALTWLARSCPTHAEEVQRRISQRRDSS